MANQVNKPNWAGAKGQAMAEVSKTMPPKTMPGINKAMPAPMGTDDMMQGMSDKMDTMMAMMEEMIAGQGPGPGM